MVRHAPMMLRVAADVKRKMRRVTPQMRFTVDDRDDVVEAVFEGWELRTQSDVLRWRSAVERELARFGRKVDLLINLDGLVVRPGVSSFFGEHRSAVLATYTKRSFRYGGDSATRTTVFTTSVLTGAAANVYPSRAAALAALKAARAASGQ
ncbi:Hypothetical protein A7982_02905 [Minicystis rosea]|nr:Hypothetical protein A7982_02905 [Minicystis rosea]